MATVGEALEEYRRMPKPERQAYMADLKKTQPERWEKLGWAIVQDKRAQKVALGMENQVTVEDQLGGPADVDSRKGANWSLRYDLGRNPSVYDKLAKLQEAHPDAKVATNAFGETQLWFRPENEESYRLADPTGPDWGDTAELLSNTGEIAGGIAGSLITKNPSLVMRMLTTGLGGMAGRAGDIAVEQARGFETREWDAIATDLGIAGGGAAAGETLAPLLTKIMNVVTARGEKNALDAGRREIVQLIESDPHLKDLGFGQSPEGLLSILRGRFSQFDAKLRLQEIEQSRGLVESLEQMVADDPNALGIAVNQMSDANINALQNNLRQKADETVAQALRLDKRTLSLDHAGKQIQWGLFSPRKEKSFRVAAEAIEKRRWDALRSLADDDFYFDMTPVLAAAEKLTKTHAAQGQAGPVIASRKLPDEMWSIIESVRSLKDGKVGKSVEVFEMVDSGVVGPDGKPIMRKESLGMQDGFEFLKTLREDLGRFFGHDSTLNSPDEGAARALWGAFKETTENPVGPQSGAFKTALVRANKATSFKHEVLDTNSMLRLAKSDNPAAILKSIEGGSVGFKQLQLLKRTMPEDRWEAVKTQLKQDLTEHPEKIDRILAKGLGGDIKRRNLFLSPAEVQSLKNYSAQVKSIDGNVFAKTLKRQTDESLRAYELFDKSTPGELRQLVAHGGEGAKNDMKAAVLEGIIRNATVDSFGQQSFDPAVITRNMDKLFGNKETAKKMHSFLSEQEINFLRDRNKLASYLSGKGFSKAGAGIAAGAVGGQMTDVTNPAGIVGAFLTARSIGLFSRAMNAPLVLKYLNNASDPFGTPQWLRTASVLSTGLASQQIPEDSDG